MRKKDASKIDAENEKRGTERRGKNWGKCYARDYINNAKEL